MNRTRSDSRYLELESSTHCNGHEAERAAICLKTNTSRTTESPSFFLPPVSPFRPSPFHCSPFLPSDRCSYYSYHLLEFRVRPALKVIDFIRGLWNISEYYRRYPTALHLLLDINYLVNIYGYRSYLVKKKFILHQPTLHLQNNWKCD